jgi:phosphatidylglycerol:prolipoprotein diacylglycerol transferase
VDTALTIFGVLPIFTFPLLISFGVGMGLFWSLWPVVDIPRLAKKRFDSAVVVLIGALLGGRVGIVLINWHYYQEHPIEIPQIWLGGFSWEGTVVGGLVALLLIARITQTSPTKLADELRPLWACVVTSAWLASWMAGHAYGIETQSWWGLPARDEWGRYATRWPTQLVGAVFTLGVHGCVEALKTRNLLRVPGLATSIEIASTAAIILVVSQFQADTRPLWRQTSITAWFSARLLVISVGVTIALVIWKRISQRKTTGRHEN